MSSPGLSEIITTTLRNRTGKLADNVSENNGLLSRLKKRGTIQTFDGGRSIVQELEYAENSTFKRYSGAETLNISASDVFTAAEFDIKQAAVAVTINGLEELQNSGENALIQLLSSRIKNAERTMMNNIAADVYSDGTADGGKQINGLQTLVADTPTSGTVGGINRATWTFWRNQYFSAASDGGAAATSANIQSYMNRLYLSTSRGADMVDLIVADNNYFRLYWESLQSIQRIKSEEGGDFSALGPSLKFNKADVIYDGGIGGNAPTNRMYFLNTNYIHFRPHSKRNFVPLEGDRFGINQDAMVKLMVFAGNMTLSNAQLQGILKA